MSFCRLRAVYVYAGGQYLESKISSSCNEEDIKQRENRIKSLQTQRADINKLSTEEMRGITIHLNIDLD